MAVFRCKMCGGALEVEDQSVLFCAYCGTRQTLPKLDDDRRANMYDRANQLRRNNEFDKAMGIYEQILSEDNTDAEAYWSLVLCRYGIEYVEDPATHRRVPTVNRAQLTSVYADENYKSALEYADVLQREVFEAEAKVIDELQKGILAISQKEEPFDVFICYKESDVSGNRTVDSVLATELYRELEREGIKTFFSRITLEDKLGSAYEPYIFAALNSSKVMVVVGTKPEHFNAAWVKNEWSRYLSLINGGARKTIIPAYKDMDPYDLPEQFAPLQAQDLSKIGAMQDIVLGVKKLVRIATPVATPSAPAVAPMLKRMFLFLEDGDFVRAEQLGEQLLNLDPENALVYVGKLMACLQIRSRSALKDHPVSFEGNPDYLKALRFADPDLKAELKGYIAYIHDRISSQEKERVYQQALSLIGHYATKESYRSAESQFRSISGYRDSDAMAQLCVKKIEEAEAAEEAARQKAEEEAEALRQQEAARQKAEEEAEKDRIYGQASELLKSNEWEDVRQAYSLFDSIPGWKDANTLKSQLRKRMEHITVQEQATYEATQRIKEELSRKVRITLTILGIVGILVGSLIYALYH